MPYVMVPVPEEHVEEVMQFLLRTLARASLEEWDHDTLTTTFSELDELAKALLTSVAKSTVSEIDLFEEDAARTVQLTQRETTAILRELNERARELNHPALLVRRAVTEALPNGRARERFAISMEPDLAPLVLDVARADLADADPTPGS